MHADLSDVEDVDLCEGVSFCGTYEYTIVYWLWVSIVCRAACWKWRDMCVDLCRQSSFSAVECFYFP